MANSSEPADITVILNRALGGDDAARERVYALLYGELVRLARSHLGGSNAPSLNPSVLVHEAYLRMLGREAVPMRDRRAFFAYASTVMRSVLVDHVRAGLAEKRGGGEVPLTLTTARSTAPACRKTSAGSTMRSRRCATSASVASGSWRCATSPA